MLGKKTWLILGRDSDLIYRFEQLQIYHIKYRTENMSNNDEDEDDVSISSNSTSDSGSSISNRDTSSRTFAEPATRILAQKNVAESAASSRSTSSVTIDDVSFLTPIPSVKKKVVRRTNL